MDAPSVQVLVGNKCDMEESKRKVPYSQGQALADEFGIQFFETSAKNNIKVDEVCGSRLPKTPCGPLLCTSAGSLLLCVACSRHARRVLSICGSQT